MEKAEKRDAVEEVLELFKGTLPRGKDDKKIKAVAEMIDLAISVNSRRICDVASLNTELSGHREAVRLLEQAVKKVQAFVQDLGDFPGAYKKAIEAAESVIHAKDIEISRLTRILKKNRIMM